MLESESDLSDLIERPVLPRKIRNSSNHQHRSPSISSSVHNSRDRMGEKPDGLSRKKRSNEGSNGRAIRNRHLVDDGAGDLIECSGKYCRSCSGSFMADCVAICCCPCAVVSFLALAFVKVPWTIGRRCLGFEKKKGHKSKRKERRKVEDTDGVIERNGNLRKEMSMEDGTGQYQIPCGILVERDGEAEQKEKNICTGIEAESIWMELYQLGHLGFGRVSFSLEST